jgi:hypothetical protein
MRSILYSVLITAYLVPLSGTPTLLPFALLADFGTDVWIQNAGIVARKKIGTWCANPRILSASYWLLIWMAVSISQTQADPT